MALECPQETSDSVRVNLLYQELVEESISKLEEILAKGDEPNPDEDEEEDEATKVRKTSLLRLRKFQIVYF